MENNDISDADRVIFRESVGPVRKIRHDRVPCTDTGPYLKSPVNRGVAASPLRKDTIDPALRELSAGDELGFKRPGVQNRVLSRLRRGQFTIQRELDLHGMTVDQASGVLQRFLTVCHSSNFRYLRIIHGKGRGSYEGKPVIKNRLNAWLRNDARVLAFCSARINDGGTGAVYVLLKQ